MYNQVSTACLLCGRCRLQEMDMKVAVLYADANQSSLCKELSAGLAEGIQAQGHDVTVIDMVHERGTVVSYYDYIAMGTHATSLWSAQILPAVGEFLKQCGTISGKRSFAFIGKKGLRLGKTLQTLMRTMESQGMYLTFSEVLSSRAQAQAVGKRLIIS